MEGLRTTHFDTGLDVALVIAGVVKLPTSRSNITPPASKAILDPSAPNPPYTTGEHNPGVVASDSISNS